MRVIWNLRMGYLDSFLARFWYLILKPIDNGFFSECIIEHRKTFQNNATMLKY